MFFAATPMQYISHGRFLSTEDLTEEHILVLRLGRQCFTCLSYLNESVVGTVVSLSL